MPPAPPGGGADRLSALLRDLGSQIRRGHDTWSEPAVRHATGRPEVDALLGGGFPCGALCEITGAHSSGRTTLALALLAATTRGGECAGVVDLADAFDPPSAEAVGVDLDRVLWARARAWREALRCTERLLETAGFPLVLLDLPDLARRAPRESLSAPRVDDERRRAPTDLAQVAGHVWLQLARRAAATRTALVLLSPERLAGAHAEIVLEMQPGRVRFGGSPPLLEGLEARAALVRHRSGPIDRVVSISTAA